MTWAVAIFPVVGVALGAALGGLGLALDYFLPSGPVAVILLASGALATGGLHLDGLMDTSDGVFGGRTIERRLEIMRDSRVGSFGVIAGALALLGQFAVLSQLSGIGRLIALVVALGLSRWAMALAIGVFRPARPSGLGATFQQAGSLRSMVLATALALGLAVGAGPSGIASFAVVLVATLAIGRFLAARLGGLTGDSYGAIAVVAETLALYVAVGFRG